LRSRAASSKWDNLVHAAELQLFLRYSESRLLRLLITLLLLGTLGSAQDSATGSSPGRTQLQDLPVWSTERALPNRYISAHGIRGFAGGYSEDGLEFWSFPLQLVSGYQLRFALPDAPIIPANSMLTSLEVDPLGVTRIYTAPDFRVREHITTHAEEPGVLVRFIVEGRSDLKIKVDFRPSLNLMWPAGIGGQETSWDKDARGFLLSEPSHQFAALISSPQATEHSELNNDRRGSDFNRLTTLTLKPESCAGGLCATLVFAGQSEKADEVHATTASLLRASEDSSIDDAKRFRSPEIVKITTPDAEANRAIEWAQIALEQAWTCNARLGCAMVAGYGPSHTSRRPQYAWYFAGDGLIATDALLNEGNYKRAADELAFLYRYQKPDDGMMWHEISQSAGFLKWASDYPYMYVHVDITFDFLTKLARFNRISGDQAFLNQHWPATLKAYQYCLSTLDKSDGLPRVPADKMSGNEQDRLTDELTLSAAWVSAAHAMSALAASMHNEALSREAESASQRARESIRSRYWDSKERRWISGFTRSGSATEKTSGADLAAIASGASTPEQTSATLDMLATPAYLTAWGLRSKPTTAADYDPAGYAKGSVWAVSTAGAAETMWRAHRPDVANALWQSLVPWASADSLGHMHEVMSGSFFTPQRESVPEQTWSSSAFLSAAIHGMLGLESDGLKNTLHFEPQVPANWKSFRVEHVRVGKSVVDLTWHSEDGHFTLEVENAGPMFHLDWNQTAKGIDWTNFATVSRDIMPGFTHLSIP
jgi:glycogen debranching enzyme